MNTLPKATRVLPPPKSVSGNEDGLPHLLIKMWPSFKPPWVPDEILIPSGSTTSSSRPSFEPDAVKSAAELVKLYHQVWQEHVSPLSSHSTRSHTEGPENTSLYRQVWQEHVSPLSSHPMSSNDTSQGLHSYIDDIEDIGDDNDTSSVLPMSSSSSLDHHLFSDIDSIELPRYKVRTPAGNHCWNGTRPRHDGI
ncbi:expressed unknown protein [Seminavis robusta]|uniref:Uncharacterized protein n=1 Tax=Seminavis robusta TaxID=568900 RepID=A0A9N8HQY4_9STRA|nr:expressed unknown protein [Seminavis robusta]|eukprot:Sro1500_g277851.1  (194) ;mRNA; r:26034-26615